MKNKNDPLLTRPQVLLDTYFANFIFVIHCLVAVVLLFFWYFKELYLIYVVVLIVTLLSDVLLDYCFLAEWEFYFRKKLHPHLHFRTFFSFYFNRIFGPKVTVKMVMNIVQIILWTSLFLNIIYWIRLYVRT